MTSITQSSYISSQSRQTSIHHRNNLQKIQADVFNRMVGLKNQKIQLLQHLSDCIDKKYFAQAQLVRLLQIKKKKQQNLATAQQYQPIVYRNIQLKTEIEQLERQVAQRARTNLQNSKNSGFVDKSRAKSVYDLTKSKNMYRSQHSKSKISIQNSKIGKTNQIRDYEDDLIDQIIQQRKANNSLIQIIRQQKNKNMTINSSRSKNLQALKEKYNALQKIISNQQINLGTQKLSRSVRGVFSSKTNRSGSENKQQVKNQVMPVTVSFGKDKHNSQVQLEELRKYISTENEEKVQLYNQLKQFVAEMEQIRQQNQRMRRQLANKNNKNF